MVRASRRAAALSRASKLEKITSSLPWRPRSISAKQATWTLRTRRDRARDVAERVADDVPLLEGEPDDLRHRGRIGANDPVLRVVGDVDVGGGSELLCEARVHQRYAAAPVAADDGARSEIDPGPATEEQAVEPVAIDSGRQAGRRFVAMDLANRRALIFDAMEAREPLRGVVTHWTGDGTGTDSIGGTNPIDSDTVRFEPGRYGSALAFEGSSTGVSFGRRLNADIVSDSPVAYAAWIKPRATGTMLHLASRTGVHGCAGSLPATGAWRSASRRRHRASRVTRRR
jgi:hypothetical protein